MNLAIVVPRLVSWSFSHGDGAGRVLVVVALLLVLPVRVVVAVLGVRLLVERTKGSVVAGQQ